MDSVFYTLQLTQSELQEVQASLLQQALLEDQVRQQKGLEPVDHRMLLEKVDALLGLSNSQIDQLAHTLDDELWEHAWYVFTDEWAWFRAKQEVLREMPKRETRDTENVQALIEQRYTSDFEVFVQEIDMMRSSFLPKK